MAQLSAMGFPEVRCQKALLATGNSDPEAAMEWLFAHMEDPGTCLISLSSLLFAGVVCYGRFERMPQRRTLALVITWRTSSSQCRTCIGQKAEQRKG